LRKLLSNWALAMLIAAFVPVLLLLTTDFYVGYSTGPVSKSAQQVEKPAITKSSDVIGNVALSRDVDSVANARNFLMLVIAVFAGLYIGFKQEDYLTGYKDRPAWARDNR